MANIGRPNDNEYFSVQPNSFPYFGNSEEERRRKEQMLRKAQQEEEIENKGKRLFKEAMGELNSLDGMDSVKDKILEALALAQIFQSREKYQLKNESHALHMIFTGNAGTGKTTVARIVGKLFVSKGLLKKGVFKPRMTDREMRGYDGGNSSKNNSEVPFVECSNADISSAFWGEDEKNMQKKVDEANGGVLFLDEAYSFISRSGHRSGEKVMATLVQEMENKRENICVIGAGYPKEMEEFIQYNSGLASRFSTVIHFPNYSVEQLLKIADTMANDRDYKMTEGYKVKLAERLEKERILYTFGNARTVRNIIEESIRKHAKRVYDKYGASPSREILITLEQDDMEEFSPVFSGKEIKDPYEELMAQAVANGIVSGGKQKLPHKKRYSNRGAME